MQRLYLFFKYNNEKQEQQNSSLAICTFIFVMYYRLNTTTETYKEVLKTKLTFIVVYYYTTSRPKCFYVRTIRTYVQYTAFTDINPTFRIYRFILFHAANKYTYIYLNTYFVVRCVHVGLANVLKFYLKRYG